MKLRTHQPREYCSWCSWILFRWGAWGARAVRSRRRTASRVRSRWRAATRARRSSPHTRRWRTSHSRPCRRSTWRRVWSTALCCCCRWAAHAPSRSDTGSECAPARTDAAVSKRRALAVWTPCRWARPLECERLARAATTRWVPHRHIAIL